MLTTSEDKQLERLYQNVGGDEGQTVPELRMDAYPKRQRVLGQFEKIPHGRYTKRVVQMLNDMHETDLAKVADLEAGLDTDDIENSQTEDSSEEELIIRPDMPRHEQNKTLAKVSGPAHKLIPRISQAQLAIEIRSSRSNETDEEMDDFIVHDEDILGVPSSLTSSPPSMKPRKKRQRLARHLQVQSSDSDEDFPDISMLIRAKVLDAVVKPAASSDGVVDSILAQKRGRKIVEDSDDE